MTAQQIQEEIQLGKFSLKINFDETLDTRILKEAVTGLDDVLTAAAELASKVIGGDAYVKSHGAIQSVEAGSCDFKDITLVLEKGKELFKTIKDTDRVKLGIICVCALIWHISSCYFEHLHEVTIESSRENVHIEAGHDINIDLSEKLNAAFPNQEEIIDAVIKRLQEIGTRDKKRGAKGITYLVHPNGIKTRGISASLTDAPEVVTDIVTAEQAEQIPYDLPAEQITPEQIKEYLPDVCIEVTKVDIESSSDKAILCRIQTEGYSQRRLPLIIHDDNLRMEVLNRFPKQMYADLYEIKTINDQGKFKSQSYVLKRLKE